MPLKVVLDGVLDENVANRHVSTATQIYYNFVFIRNNIVFFIEIQVLYILCYGCDLFILLIKWILQNLYEFQRRETLATNRTVENNKKNKEMKFRGKP